MFYFFSSSTVYIWKKVRLCRYLKFVTVRVESRQLNYQICAVLLFQGLTTALCYFLARHWLLHTYIVVLVPLAIAATAAFCYINKGLIETESEENVTIIAEMSEIRNDEDDNSTDGSQRSLVVDS